MPPNSSTNNTAEADRPAIEDDIDTDVIVGTGALESGDNPLPNVIDARIRLDLNQIDNRLDAADLSRGFLRSAPLIWPGHSSCKRHEPSLDLHSELGSRDLDVPVEYRQNALRDLAVGRFWVIGEADLDLFGDPCDAIDATRRLFCRHLLRISGNEPAERHDAVLGGHADMCVIEPRVVPELLHYVVLELAIRLLDQHGLHSSV